MRPFLKSIIFYYGQVNLRFSETNLLEENALVHRLYIATGINALRRDASRKLSIKTLRSAISLHPHYSIVTIARLRQLFSGRSVATAWCIEGVARGINSCINYHEDLSPSIYIIYAPRHHISFRANCIFKQCYDFICRPSGKKKKKRKSHSYKFYRAGMMKKEERFQHKKWIKFATKQQPMVIGCIW